MLSNSSPAHGDAGRGVEAEAAGPAAAVSAATSQAAQAFAAEQRRPTFSAPALLRAIADGIEAAAPELRALALEETGLGEARLDGELARTTGQLRAFAAIAESGAELDAIIDRAVPGATPPRPDQRRLNVPLGPVAVFAASNFPFAFGVAGGDTAAALAAGCPVVAKAHPAQPRTSTRLGEIVAAAVREAGAPGAWFALLHGDGPLVGQLLAAAHDVEAVAFTGSFAGGMALARTAALRERPIPVFAEMGSVNPLLVTPRAAAARGEAIADGLAASVAQSAGQLCTKPGLLALVDDDAGRALADRLAEQLAATPPAPMLTPGLRERFADGLDTHARDARVRVRANAAPDPRPGTWQAAGLLEARAAELRREDPLLEELFGPAAVVLWCADADELLALARERLPGSLTATLHAEADEPLAADLAPLLAARAGRVVFDGYPTGVAVAWATVHGGPHPATTAPASTSVGLTAARRFMRPVGHQGWPDALLPPALRDANPLGLVRRVDGELTDAPIERTNARASQ